MYSEIFSDIKIELRLSLYRFAYKLVDLGCPAGCWMKLGLGVIGCGLNMCMGVLKLMPNWAHPFGCSPTQLTDLLMTTYDMYNIADGVCIVK